jgi:hypothetical protein
MTADAAGTWLLRLTRTLASATRHRRGVPGNGTLHPCKEVTRKACGDFEAALREFSG